jgi:uncharacterized protein (TIGR03437 family)
MKSPNRVIAFAALAAASAFAQNLDSSGNGLLKGAFHFRQLQVSAFDQTAGDVTEAVAIAGTITFDGAGKYTVTGTSVDNTVSGGSPQTINTTGTYTIGANGFGFIVNPIDASDTVFGSVGQGVFVGSSTEGNVANTFIAIPAGTAPTNATFTASYWAGLIDFSGASGTGLKNALFQLTPNGQGTFGTITLKGQAESQSSSALTQTASGATYTFPGDGSIAINVPTPAGVTAANALFSGSKTMFVSADGNFILGYTANGYDLLFGVKALSATATNGIYSGLYYTSALEDGPSLGNSCGTVDAYYGSLISDGNTNQILHERLAGSFCSAIDFQTNNQTTFTANGTASDLSGYQYAFGDGGNAFVAVGSGGFYSLLAGVHANTFTGSGVFLNPIGVTNAASFAPITASVAPGELITLYGSGFTNATQTTQGGQAFQTTLGGVQVLVNNTPAPIYYVSATQISAILPYAISSASIASIQVSNNGTKSNPVTLFISDAMPGVFSQTQNGLGLAAALHATTGKLVTPNNPAVAGEYISVFMTGLGTVTPTIQDGALGPAGTLAYADIYNSSLLQVLFNDYTNKVFPPAANVTFAGLAPGLAGLYQVNVQVPKGLGPGNVYLEFVTDGADVNQIQVPVGSSGVSAVAPLARPGVAQVHGRPMARRQRGLKNRARTIQP